MLKTLGPIGRHDRPKRVALNAMDAEDLCVIHRTLRFGHFMPTASAPSVFNIATSAGVS